MASKVRKRIASEAKSYADAQYGGAIAGARDDIRTNNDTAKEMVRREGMYAKILGEAYSKPVASDSYNVAKQMVAQAASEGSNGASAGTQEASAGKVNAYNSYLARQYVNSNLALEGQRNAVAARSQDRLLDTQRVYRQRGDKLTDQLSGLRQQRGNAYSAQFARLLENQRGRDSAERQAKQAAEAERYKAQLQNQLAMAQLQESQRHNQASESAQLLSIQAKAASAGRGKKVDPFSRNEKRMISWLGEHQIPYFLSKRGGSHSMAWIQQMALKGIKDGTFTTTNGRDALGMPTVEKTPNVRRFSPDMWAAAMRQLKRSNPRLVAGANRGANFYR